MKNNSLVTIAKRSTHLIGRMYCAQLTPTQILVLSYVSKLEDDMYWEAMDKKKNGISGLIQVSFRVNDNDISVFLAHAK